MSCDYVALASAGIRELQPYQPGKPVEELERELGISGAIKLASNENPLGPSPKVADAVAGAIPELSRYPDGSAFHLKRKLSDFLGVPTNTLTIGNGSNDVLELLARVFLNPSNEAIVSEHSFVVYPLAAKALGAGLKVVPARNYGQDLEATLNTISARTRMVFIANPNNPTGTYVNEASLTDFLDQLRDDVIVVLDEAYFEYVQAEDYPNGIALHERYPNVVVTRTFSKAYGLAALRLGYSVSHPDIADMMNRVRQPFNVNSISLAAALVALDDQDHVKRAVAMNSEGLRFLAKACDDLGLAYIPSVGNFLTIDFGRDAGPIYEALLREGVIVRPIGVYGLPNHLRVTVGTPDENRRFVESARRVLDAPA
ncbi:MAG: histidinol-phosphate transaminase [Pseudomonadales bacterium]|nr:histidinol-phosphate transaminase [Pseudomonadales bacterium]